MIASLVIKEVGSRRQVSVSMVGDGRMTTMALEALKEKFNKRGYSLE